MARGVAEQCWSMTCIDCGKTWISAVRPFRSQKHCGCTFRLPAKHGEYEYDGKTAHCKCGWSEPAYGERSARAKYARHVQLEGGR